jgi:hypothetical protein
VPGPLSVTLGVNEVPLSLFRALGILKPGIISLASL